MSESPFSTYKRTSVDPVPNLSLKERIDGDNADRIRLSAREEQRNLLPFAKRGLKILEDWDVRSSQILIQTLSELVEELPAYTLSNYTETRTLDASTASAGDVADVLCTLIADLVERING